MSYSAHSTVSAPLRQTQALEFALASAADDAAIRRFLAGQSMPGGISLELRTEPSFFDAVALLGDAEVLVARSRDSGDIAGLGVRTRRRVWLEGSVKEMGYLSFLRVAETFRRRGDMLRMGYAAIGDLQRQEPVAFHLTAILRENHRARRLLEAGLRGLPTYTPVADILTFTMGTCDRRLGRLSDDAIREGDVHEDEQAGLRGYLDAHWRRLPCAPVADQAPSGWHLQSGCGDFVAVRDRARIVAAAAIWDQRRTRQWVVTGYSSLLGAVRIPWNAWQHLRGRPFLPAPGQPLNMGYVSCLGIDPDRPQDFQQLLRLLVAKARQRGIDYVVLSLASAHPLAPVACGYAGPVTQSILYTVRWPDDPIMSIPGLPYVEAGML